MDIFEIVRKVLDLGWPGIVLFQVAVVWNAYQAQIAKNQELCNTIVELRKSLLDVSKTLE